MFINEVRAKSPWHVEVYLQGTALPVAPDCVPQHELQLRSVERPLTFVQRVLDARGLRSGDQSFFSRVPNFVGTHALPRAVGELDAHIFAPEITVDFENQLRDRDTFRGDLSRCNTDVTVVLREGACPHQPVKRTGW